MWNSNTTFSGNYSYNANTGAEDNSSAQSGKRHLALLALLALCAACYFLFSNNTTARSQPVPVVSEATRKDTTSKKKTHDTEKKPAQPIVKKAETNKTQLLIESPAPAKPSELTEKDVMAFIEKWAWLAKTEQKRTGVPASISLAQAIIESRCGTSRLATGNNNYFGIKCFSRNCKDGHCTNRKDDHHKDFFRKFKTKKESWIAHSNFLCQNRYKPLHGRNWRGWANGLKEKGYATDRNYATTLISIIQRYKLYEYDKQ